MSQFWSPFIHDLVPYTPGEQPKGQTFIKLNTNENPYGPSPAALQAIRDATGDGLRLYPDPSASDLVSTIAADYAVPADHVFVGNGSDEVLAHAFNSFFRDKGPVLFPDVSYSFYPTFCRLYDVPSRIIPLDDSFQLDLNAFRGPCGGIVIANPNAPTGIAISLAEIRTLLSHNPDVVVLVDEAYVDFGAESAVSLVREFENLLVVQTFSKSRSLAGLRVGFAIGQPPLIEALRRLKDSFNSYPLGRLALAGATAAWKDRAWFDRTRTQVMTDRDKLAADLQAQGFQVLPSKANFVFASYPGLEGGSLQADLRTHGILVRHWKTGRISNWLRITIGTSAQCATLTETTRTITANKTA